VIQIQLPSTKRRGREANDLRSDDFVFSGDVYPADFGEPRRAIRVEMYAERNLPGVRVPTET